jgi:glutathione S-transferase
MKGPEYLAVNPMGKVPALKHGDAVVSETAAILAYLADAFPGANLAPPHGSPARGAYYRWLFFIAGPMEAAWTNTACGFIPTAEQQQMSGYGSLPLVLDALEGAIKAGGPYLCGDQFTAADVYLSASLGFGMQFGLVDQRAAFVAYRDLTTSRPACVRALEIDDALVAQSQKPAQ